MTTATQFADRPAIEYPDDDGEPMSDNTLQFKWIVCDQGKPGSLSFATTPTSWSRGICCGTRWKASQQFGLRLTPWLRLVGRKAVRGSYKQWEEGGIAPQVVFETLSPGNRPPEMQRKLEFYERYGVEEYYIYDPDDGLLEGWLRKGGRLVKVNDMSGFVSPRLRIRFEPGPDNLTIWGPDGEQFQAPQEDIYLRKEAQKRAEEADRVAAIERQRADEADRLRAIDRQRADFLAAKLRKLGIDPDSK